MISRPKVFWFLTLIAFVLMTRPGRAALQFDVFAGYDGVIHEAAWFPITVEIFNDGPAFNAVIQVSGGQFGSDQVREVPVELPTNTRKRFVIPMFASGGRFNMDWSGKLIDAKGKVIQERLNLPTKIVASESTVLGALPRNFGGLPLLPEIKNNRQDLKPEVARFTVDQFPDNPITLEGLDAMYLNSEKAPELRVNQVTALLAWVRGGGHLIVAAEQISDINGTPWLKQFLPADLSDTRNIKLGQELISWIESDPSAAREADPAQPGMNLQVRQTQQDSGRYQGVNPDPAFKDTEIPVATGSLRDGAVLFGSGGVPLAIEAPRGRGKITLLTFSPEREPFRSWDSRQFFWARISEIPPRIFEQPENIGWGGWSIDGVFGALIDSRQIKKLPVAWLLLLLVVYLLVIGPFDQWWLKKIGRQMLTWITFPAYVVLFSLLIYFIGYKLRAGETEWNELNIVDLYPRGEQVDLRGHTYISIYSSGNTRYPLEGQEGYATIRSELADMHSGTRDNSRAKVVHQGDSFKAELEGLVWTSSLYANEWFQTNDTPFMASVMETGTDYQIEAENLLGRPIPELYAVVGELVFELKGLEANERKTFRVNASEGRPLRDFVRENGSIFQQAVEMRRNPLGDSAGGQLENRPVTTMTASFISYLNDFSLPGRTFTTPPGLDLSEQVQRGDAVFFGWLPGFSFTEKINAFEPPRFRRDTLMRLSVPVRNHSAI